jgi:hypothetical protein
MEELGVSTVQNCCMACISKPLLDTADRLTRRGLDHPHKCPLCDQEEDTSQHLLLSCVFAQVIWFTMLSSIGYHNYHQLKQMRRSKNGGEVVVTGVPNLEQKLQFPCNLDNLVLMEVSERLLLRWDIP